MLAGPGIVRLMAGGTEPDSIVLEFFPQCVGVWQIANNPKSPFP